MPFEAIHQFERMFPLRAMITPRFGPPSLFEEHDIEKPEAGPGEVLISRPRPSCTQMSGTSSDSRSRESILRDDPDRVDDSGYVAQKREQYVQPKMPPEPDLQEHSHRREDYRQDDTQYVHRHHAAGTVRFS